MIRLLAFLMATPAAAQMVCAPPELATKSLVEKYGETPMAEGDGPFVGHVSTWWANPSTGTWTVVATLPNGDMCFILSGTGFRAAKMLPAGAVN